jgi:ZIP family zinc transporter
MSPVLVAFGLTLFAGLATGIGSLIALFARTSSRRFLSAALGFSAGVMIYVSMIEIFPKARAALQHLYDARTATLLTTVSFFVGMLLIAIIDKLIPSYENPHDVKSVEAMGEGETPPQDMRGLHRMGVMTAVAIGIHNFPEGLATFMAALQDPTLGVAIAVAIAIHNIPEGISISVPIYFSTGSRKKAFYYSFLSGLSEPVGALVGYFLLRAVVGDLVFGMVFAGVAGIMVFISLDELLPAAREYGEHHVSIYGLVAGMAVMATSLILFM